MKELKIIASGRCFFPGGAFWSSTKKQAEIARNWGYAGIEFLPIWRVVAEFWRYGQLLAPKDMIASFHRDWRFDRVMEAKVKNKPWWYYQLKNKEDWLFPPSSWSLTTLQKLQNIYRLPVSTVWFTDTQHFSPVMLELWGKAQGIDYRGLLKWFKQDPVNHGVVLDTAKLSGWLASNDLVRRKREVITSLLPHVFEVHYRFKKINNRMAMVGDKDWGELEDDSTDNLKLIVSLGFTGRIVAEYGWPDIDSKIDRLDHKQVIDFLNNLSHT